MSERGLNGPVYSYSRLVCDHFSRGRAIYSLVVMEVPS